MRKSTVFVLWPALILALAVASGFQTLSPKDILSRSVNAHGGARLADWKSMTMQGTIDMSDGIMFRSAYLVFAEPGKLRIERDMTVTQGGRYFYEDFLNGDAAWSRRNLIPARGNLEEMKKKLNQCYGIAYYESKAESLARKEDGVVEWREKPDLQSNAFRIVASRPAYVVTATVGKDVTDLYIDKENFFFLQEVAGRAKRVFWDFKKFGDVTLPGKTLEINVTNQGEQLTPYAFQAVKYNIPIEPWLFTEDMPKTATPVKR
jgi:hypothetical protein